MNKWRLLAHRTSIYVILLLGMLILILLNFWAFFFLKKMEGQILAHLKQQFKHYGQITARLFDGEDLENIHPGDETSPTVLYYQQLLYELRSSGQLTDIVVLSLDQKILIDYRVNFTIGDSTLRIPVNWQIFNQAAIGQYPEPELIAYQDSYFITSYTPIVNPVVGNVVAVLLMETPTQFFTTLYSFRRSLMIFGFGSLGLIVFFSMIILLAIRQLFQAERRLQQQQRLAELGQMSAMMAHEIRNPLSIMKGAAEVVRKQPQRVDMLTFISEEIDRLNRLVNEFLQFARKSEFHWQNVDMEKLVQHIISQLQDSRIHLQIDHPLPPIMSDEDAIRQILLNIINNALKVIDAQQGKITVTLRKGASRKEAIQLEVTDNGPGMDEETRKRIFEPFFSTTATGSGLGLTITRQLIEQLGGHITVKSAPGQGTTVTLAFPKKPR